MTEHENVYWVKGGVWTEVDAEKPDYERFPRLKQAHLFPCEVNAGEMLFLPEGWFHCVRSTTPSMSVNYWVVTSRGIFNR